MSDISLYDMHLGVEQPDSDYAYFQVDGNDLVSLSLDRARGVAWLTVFNSTHPNGSIAWQGEVNLIGHLASDKENHS